jgi:hypothetical protein
LTLKSVASEICSSLFDILCCVDLKRNILILKIVLDKQKIVIYLHPLSGCSVARLSRLLWEQEAAGSNPATPTKILSVISERIFSFI